MGKLYDTYSPKELAEILEGECTNGDSCMFMSGTCWMCEHCQAAFMIRQWNRIWENDNPSWKVVKRDTIDVDDETKRIRDERDYLQDLAHEVGNMIFRLKLALDKVDPEGHDVEFEERLVKFLSASIDTDGV